MKKDRLFVVLLVFIFVSLSLSSDVEEEGFMGSGNEIDGSGETDDTIVEQGDGVSHRPTIEEPERPATRSNEHFTEKEDDVIFDTDQTNSEPEIKASEDRDGRQDQLSIEHPAVLALIIGGAIFILLIILLLIMFIVYRLRKKDEGSYALDENMKKKSKNIVYTKAPMGQNEFFA